MQKYQSYIKTFYILILGFVFSGTLILGAIVAPVVFHSSEFISNVALTRFENGELMSEIFRRFSMIIIRSAKITDFDGLLPLLDQLGYQTTKEELESRFTSFLNNEGYGVAVACIDTKIVGFVAWSP